MCRKCSCLVETGGSHRELEFARHALLACSDLPPVCLCCESPVRQAHLYPDSLWWKSISFYSEKETPSPSLFRLLAGPPDEGCFVPNCHLLFFLLFVVTNSFFPARG